MCRTLIYLWGRWGSSYKKKINDTKSGTCRTPTNNFFSYFKQIVSVWRLEETGYEQRSLNPTVLEIDLGTPSSTVCSTWLPIDGLTIRNKTVNVFGLSHNAYAGKQSCLLPKDVVTVVQLCR